MSRLKSSGASHYWAQWGGQELVTSDFVGHDGADDRASTDLWARSIMETGFHPDGARRQAQALLEVAIRNASRAALSPTSHDHHFGQIYRDVAFKCNLRRNDKPSRNWVRCVRFSVWRGYQEHAKAYTTNQASLVGMTSQVRMTTQVGMTSQVGIEFCGCCLKRVI